jgi:exportin-1
MQQSGEQEPFIDEILRNLQRITADLSPLQIHTFYEAVGYMISAQPNKPQQEQLIANLMTAPNAAVRLLVSLAVRSVADALPRTDSGTP